MTTSPVKMNKTDTSKSYKIENIVWENFDKYKINKCKLTVKLINSMCFLENIENVIKHIYYNNILVNLKYNEKSRVGICLILPPIEYPINMEFSRLDEMSRKLKSIEDRVLKVSQSSKLSDVELFQIIFTFLNIKIK